MSGVVLLGASGHASDVLAVLESLGAIDVAVSDDAAIDRRRFDGRARILEMGIDETCALDAEFTASVAWHEVRRFVVRRCDALGVAWAPPKAHSAGTVHSASVLDVGSDVFGQTGVSSHVRVGAHVHVGYGATVGHDSRIGDFTSVMPATSAGGDATVGEGSMVGANATVLQGVSIGPGAVIGAGAVVTADVAAGDTVVGVPARTVGR